MLQEFHGIRNKACAGEGDERGKCNCGVEVALGGL